MSEETEGQDTGAEAVAGGLDPAAVALALDAAKTDPSIAEDARAFLRKQAALIDDQRALVQLQAKELSHELGLRHWSLWVRHASGLLKLALELSAGLLLLVAVVGLSMMVWGAAHAEGLIIESFSVPPDLAARGLTGQVVATHILDKLTVMQNDSKSIRASKSYTNNWGDDIEVQIPETGISIGEAKRFLRGWLGHETHITGEVYRTASGIAVTARVGGDAGATFGGSESDLDGIVQKAAEHVYAITQPYRYARYLTLRTTRSDEARAIFNQLIQGANPYERAWAWHGLANVSSIDESNERAALYYEQAAISAYPDLTASYNGLGSSDEPTLGHTEAALAYSRKALQLLNRSSITDVGSYDVIPLRLQNGALVAFDLGDYSDALNLATRGAESIGPDVSTPLSGFQDLVMLSLARRHDGIGARAYLNELPPSLAGSRARTRFLVDAALENWHAVVASEESIEKIYVANNPHLDLQTIFGTQLRPFLALAKARLGDTTGAEAAIATTPTDCYDCIRMRGKIAAVEGNWGRANYWFARAVHDGPSLPFAYTDWGYALLNRGQTDAAIEKFQLANQKGPHFGDPLEMWGEALMAKNQSHRALAKFAEAEKYAPNWGRLHLKWGEALVYAGKKDEAKAQFARAGQLDLTPSENAEMAGVTHG